MDETPTPEMIEQQVAKIIENHHCDSWTSGTACAKEVLEALTRIKQPAEPIKRFRDGKPKPYLSPERYDQLRDDDQFLYNRGPAPTVPTKEPAASVEALSPRSVGEVERLREALNASDEWLSKWADHASFCAGRHGTCPCKLSQVREANSAALRTKDGVGVSDCD